MDHTITAKTVAHVYTPGLEQRDGLNGALHLFGVDAIGSVRALINDDSGQAVTDTQGYYAYGLTRSRTGSDWMPFGFAGADGYQTDPNELMLLGNREYHPFTGRFLTRDPAHAGSNDYEYAYNNPLIYADPNGTDASSGVAPTQLPGIPDLNGTSYGNNVTFPGVNGQVTTNDSGDEESGQSIINAESTLMMSPGAGPGSASKLAGLEGVAQWAAGKSGCGGGPVGILVLAISQCVPEGPARHGAESIGSSILALDQAYGASARITEAKAILDARASIPWWRLFGQSGKIAATVEGNGALAGGTLGVGAALIGAAIGGWQAGTALSEIPLIDGQTVVDIDSDYLATNYQSTFAQ